MWVALVSACGANVVGELYADRRGRTQTCQRPLPDVVHELAPPEWTAYERYVDAFPVAAAGALGVAAARGAEVDIGRLVGLATVLYTMRAATVSVTVLPSPICQGTTRSQAIGGCHGCIFSGHTAATLVLAHALARAAPRLAPACLAYSVGASVVIAATRAHYTVDVFVAWIAYAAACHVLG